MVYKILANNVSVDSRWYFDDILARAMRGKLKPAAGLNGEPQWLTWLMVAFTSFHVVSFIFVFSYNLCARHLPVP